MTRVKHRARWPRTGANVNDALSVSGHHLAKGAGAHYSARTLRPPSALRPPQSLPLVTDRVDHTNNDVIIIRGRGGGRCSNDDDSGQRSLTF